MCGDPFSSEVERHVFWFDLRMIVIMMIKIMMMMVVMLLVMDGGDEFIFVVMVNVQLPFLPPIAWEIMVVAQIRMLIMIMIFDKDI